MHSIMARLGPERRTGSLRIPITVLAPLRAPSPSQWCWLGLDFPLQQLDANSDPRCDSAGVQRQRRMHADA